jgi:hypothetical protein
MGSAQGVGPRFFPLDEELALLPGCLTPLGHEQLVRLAGWMPFERAAELFEDFTRIEVSSALSRRYTEKAGEVYVELQTKEMEQLEREKPAAPSGADKLQISADGAMVPLLHGEWGEARTLVIGEVQPVVEEKGKAVVHTRNLSYFSRKVPAEEFERLALVEIHRRGVENAREVAAIQDGAEWEQGFVDYHCPKAVRILDFPHAGEHINQVGQFLYGEGTPQARQWLEERLHRLKENGPEELLEELCALDQQHPQAEQVSGNLTYLQKRQAQMQYPLFQAQGWPIGSGIVESGNKLVVEARLKGSGMHWADTHVDPMLAIRNILCSDRWKMEWPKIANRLRHPHPLPPDPTKVISIPFERPAPPLPASLQHPHQPGPDARPPKNNPWRNFKYGHSLFRSKVLPKN